MNLLCKAMSQLRIEEYLTCSTAMDIQKSINILNSEVNDESTMIKVNEIESMLLQSWERVTRTRESFDKFVEESSKESKQFKYWSIFLDELYPVLCDLTVSHRNCGWLLHLSTVIGFLKQKGTVAKWNLIKHEKLQYVSWLNELCRLTVDDEYSLHHEFSNATTKEDIEPVQSIKKYAASHQDPFDISLTKHITNIAIGEMLQNFKIEYLLNLVKQGETLYKQFVETCQLQQ